jgi:hypothetical protein
MVVRLLARKISRRDFDLKLKVMVAHKMLIRQEDPQDRRKVSFRLQNLAGMKLEQFLRIVINNYLGNYPEILPIQPTLSGLLLTYGIQDKTVIDRLQKHLEPLNRTFKDACQLSARRGKLRRGQSLNVSQKQADEWARIYRPILINTIDSTATECLQAFKENREINPDKIGIEIIGCLKRKA